MIYKMPYSKWIRIFNFFEALSEEEVPYVDMNRPGWDTEYEPVEEYIKHEFGLEYLRTWDSLKDKDDLEQRYHYQINDPHKFTVFLLKWA